MEYLLREKLEKLVQGQIEARMASMKRDGKSFDASIVTALKVLLHPSSTHDYTQGCTPRHPWF